MSTAHATSSLEPSPLLRVGGLSVTYVGKRKSTEALHQVAFDIAPGEIVGILGESGSGKSTLACSILGLLPANASVEGSISFLRGNRQSLDRPGADLQHQHLTSDDSKSHDLKNADLQSEDLQSEDLQSEDLKCDDLLRVDESRRQSIRGARIAMIFQDPGLALSPVMRVGEQIVEVIRAHQSGARNLHRGQCEALLREVGLSDLDRIYKAYPHQLSGGQIHRVVIAQAIACRPDLIIADEPTRSLDVTLQAEIVNVLREINRKFGSAFIFITHNPALLAGFADRVIVMYAGRIVEQGPVPQVLRQPLHPYTKGLLDLIPRYRQADSLRPHRSLPVIPGSLTDLDGLTRGCVFEPRCSARSAVCRDSAPSEVTPERGRRVSCFNYGN